MHNGIGLPTPRGSGTSGHVQRNQASIHDRVLTANNNSHNPLVQLEMPSSRPLNKDILEHDKKRKIELECIELSDKLEEQGYTEEEINAKVDSLRKLLLENYEKSRQ